MLNEDHLTRKAGSGVASEDRDSFPDRISLALSFAPRLRIFVVRFPGFFSVFAERKHSGLRAFLRSRIRDRKARANLIVALAPSSSSAVELAGENSMSCWRMTAGIRVTPCQKSTGRSVLAYSGNMTDQSGRKPQWN